MTVVLFLLMLLPVVVSAWTISPAVGTAAVVQVSVWAPIVSDTFGRPWREGVVNVALGVAGVQPLVDYRETVDSFGRSLKSTVIALADELASAAEIVTRKAAGTPVAIVRGAAEWIAHGTGRALVRDAERDLFR